MGKYILSIDQSTQGTKALILNEAGEMICRSDLPHRQMISGEGWVSHDLTEIYQNTLQVIQLAVEKAGISKEELVGMGISNQRETTAAWRKDGTPVCPAIVWQCARASQLCERLKESGKADANLIQQHTGIPLSPFFPAAKLAWILENVAEAKELAATGELYYGTIDTYLLYRLTEGREYRTDYSNASRTQLFHIHKLAWDRDICKMFGIDADRLPLVTDSNGYFGSTNLGGYLTREIPIHGVLGDSHGALFGQGCTFPGAIKATYGTGSSIMMNIGREPIHSKHGLITSLAWSMNGEASYVLEGNINYAGAVITWLKDDVKLIDSPAETELLAKEANPEDETYLVPAFSGLGAPYWCSDVRGILSGISRTTGREEIVRAGLDCIVYQITDILKAMSEDSEKQIAQLRVDGGPTHNGYLMQLQADMAQAPVMVSEMEEASGIGAGLAAGYGLGLYNIEEIHARARRKAYTPAMEEALRQRKYQGWLDAVHLVTAK